MKISTNFEDKNRIREWAAEGLDADAISERVRVKPEAVQAYLDSLTPELTRGQKAAATRAANKAAKEAREEDEAEEAESTGE